MSFKKERNEMISWAKALNQKGLITAKSGNISYKVDADKVLITAHDSYLGYLEEKDILVMDLKGNVLEGRGELTSEQSLHLGIYNKFSEIRAVLHAHSPFTTAFFHYFEELEIFSYESKFYLGKVAALTQDTPTVTEIEPALSALEKNSILVLKHHGVVAMGSCFKEAFSLIELLEEQSKVNLLIKGAVSGKGPLSSVCAQEAKPGQKAKQRMLSKEHADKLTELVNNDPQAQDLGQKYGLTCTLAVKNQDNGDAMCFYYDKGKITKVDNSDNAEFVIIGRENILRQVFNRQIDPFVAVTQGKVKTKGDFAKMSRWYPVMVRTFKLWEQAPVE